MKIVLAMLVVAVSAEGGLRDKGYDRKLQEPQFNCCSDLINSPLTSCIHDGVGDGHCTGWDAENQLASGLDCPPGSTLAEPCNPDCLENPNQCCSDLSASPLTSCIHAAADDCSCVGWTSEQQVASTMDCPPGSFLAPACEP
mmetsp:Transcript_924/g.1882  ORF Transcript_924/g.1882 Transcript_924/m.1882 type:complete len:142 (-) Transcript_924:351-776(-)